MARTTWKFFTRDSEKKKANERGLFRRQRLTELLLDTTYLCTVFSPSTNFHAVGGFKKAQLNLVYQWG